MRHQDQQVAQERKKSSAGRPLEYALTSLPRTVLSSARNAQESRTAVLVRREMQAWHLLQLEPAAMRLPDSFGAPDHIAPNGAHLAATLYRVARAASKMSTASGDMAADNPVLVRLANRLSELVSSVRSVRVTRDEQRRLYRLLMTEADGSEWPAASLSDGTVRFLALALLEEDPKETGLICMEEPENGVHPARIGAMLSLLQDIAVDATCAIGDDNPLRQVIVNTHSPIVAMDVDHRDLILAQPLGRQALRSGPVIQASPLRATLLFRAVGGSWRTQVDHALGPVAFGDILAYLNPSMPGSDEEGSEGTAGRHSVRKYVNDKQMELRLMTVEHDPE